MERTKRGIIKSQCFRAAVDIFSNTLGRGQGIMLRDADIKAIYSMAIDLFNDGKKRYWKDPYPYNPPKYKPKILKRAYLWVRKKLWEEKL